MPKYLKQAGGDLIEEATVTAGGAGNANKIPELDGNGRLVQSMMPSGIGADTAVIVASEALAAGDFVNIYNNTGTPTCRKADAGSNKPAHGYVTAAVASAGNATIMFDDTNDQVTGQTAGAVYLSATTPGAATATAPTGSGKLVQKLGVATGATSIHVNIGPTITLA